MKIRFVLSGFTSFMSLYSSDGLSKEQKFKILNQITEKINNSFQTIRVDYLLNAVNEQKELEKFKDEFLSSNIDLFIDSGGLQMTTRFRDSEIENFDSFRDKVYQIQAKNADYAFSFDDIPIKRIGDPKMFMSMIDYILEDQFYERGLNANKYLKRQIKIFKQLNAKGKILPVIQSPVNSEKNLYYEALKQDINDDLIGGISFGGISFAGTYLSIIKILSKNVIEDDFYQKHSKKLIHFLGIGSPSRIVVISQLYKNGWFPTDALSFDSTKVFKEFINGNLYTENNNIITIEYIGKKLNKKNVEILKEHYDLFKEFIEGIVYDNFEDFINHHVFFGEKIKKHKNQSRKEICPHELTKKYFSKVIHSMANTYYVCKMLENFYNGTYDETFFFKSNKSLQEFNMFKNLKAFDWKLVEEIKKEFRKNAVNLFSTTSKCLEKKEKFNQIFF